MRGMVAIIILIFSACAHVDFSAPPATLTPAQRVAMFNALHGVSEEALVTRTCSPACSTTETRTLELANGTKVESPEDLLPLLPPASESAQHIHAAAQLNQRGGLWSGGGLACLLLGFAVGLNVVGTEPDGSQDWSKAKIFIYGGIIAAGIGYLGYYHYRGEALIETSLAYRTYSAGLAERLNVCVDGVAIVPCEGAPPPNGAPALTAPIPAPR